MGAHEYCVRERDGAGGEGERGVSDRASQTSLPISAGGSPFLGLKGEGGKEGLVTEL